MRVHLARHAEAQKNLVDRHGGIGAPLTGRGRAQALQLAATVKFLEVDHVMSAPRRQCIETAELVSAKLGLEMEIRKDIRPYDLGIADGLSQSELRNLAPKVSDRMDAWRQGELEIGDLRIPGAEDPQSYYDLGATFLNRLPSSRNSLLVGTRSILVLLWNVAHGRTPQRRGGYREVPWDNAEVRAVDLQGGLTEGGQ